MSDNSPEAIEEIANFLRSADVVGFTPSESVRIVVEKLRAAAAQALKLSQLRESAIDNGCAIHETGADVFVQNIRAESAESANRALRDEVERLREALRGTANAAREFANTTLATGTEQETPHG